MVPSGSLDPLASTVTVAPTAAPAGAAMRATGARFVIVSVTAAAAVAPWSSVTQTRTVRAPGAAGTKDAWAPGAVGAGSGAPSPSRSQAKETIRPSGSLDAPASRRTVVPRPALDGPESFATGGRSSTRTATVATAVRPRASVAFAVTVAVPGVVNVAPALVPLASNAPSPFMSHWTLTTFTGEADVSAVHVRRWPDSTLGAAHVARTAGGGASETLTAACVSLMLPSSS